MKFKEFRVFHEALSIRGTLEDERIIEAFDEIFKAHCNSFFAKKNDESNGDYISRVWKFRKIASNSALHGNKQALVNILDYVNSKKERDLLIFDEFTYKYLLNSLTNRGSSEHLAGLDSLIQRLDPATQQDTIALAKNTKQAIQRRVERKPARNIQVDPNAATSSNKVSKIKPDVQNNEQQQNSNRWKWIIGGLLLGIIAMLSTKFMNRNS